MKNIIFNVTQVTFSMNVYAAVFKKILDIYPDEGDMSNHGDSEEMEMSSISDGADSESTNFSDEETGWRSRIPIINFIITKSLSMIQFY